MNGWILAITVPTGKIPGLLEIRQYKHLKCLYTNRNDSVTVTSPDDIDGIFAKELYRLKI